MTRGDWKQLDSTWNDVSAATSVADRIYAVAQGGLYRVDADGGYDVVSDDEWRSTWMVGVAGYLVSIEPNGGMYRVDPRDGSFAELDGNWQSTIAATAGGDYVYVIEKSGTLYRVSPADGSYTELNDGFTATTCLTAAAGTLVLIDAAGTLCRVSPKDGSWEDVDHTWANSRTAAGDDQRAYVASGEGLYAVDPHTGSYEELTDTTWGPRHLVTMGGRLFSFEGAGGLYRIELS